MKDRTNQPAVQTIQNIHFVEPRKIEIAEDTTLFWVNEVMDETFRMELHFNAGTIKSEMKIAGITNTLLFSGTSTKTSFQINEELDSLGAFIDHEIGQETAIVSIYCLKNVAEKVIEIILDSLQNASFNEHELADTLREKKQQYLIGSEKVSMLARREFQKRFFTNSEAYSRQISIDDYEKINRSMLVDFHAQNYLHGLRKIVIVSAVDQELIDTVCTKLKPFANNQKTTFENTFINEKGHFHVNKEGALQTAIRMGLPLFNKTHNDFIDFQILQTILGDYFGSRLMSNIREDKGYTYGIGTGVSESHLTGYFIISTEVGQKFVEPTLNEIKYEFERLKNEEVPLEELNLVKNYLLGQLLKSADGPNAMMDLYMNVQLHGLGFDYFEAFIKRVNAITSKDLIHIANKYLQFENFTIITAGSSN